MFKLKQTLKACMRNNSVALSKFIRLVVNCSKAVFVVSNNCYCFCKRFKTTTTTTSLLSGFNNNKDTPENVRKWDTPQCFDAR